MLPRQSPVHTWLQLFRAPNLFTVPGDPLAGFLLASGGSPRPILIGIILASLCFYGFGLLLNDLADLEEDRRERSRRPLPSGAANPSTVRWVAAALAAAGLLFCLLRGPQTFYLGLLLLAVITAYNLWSKSIPILGPLNMGACRGLSLLLGAWEILRERTEWSPASHVSPPAILVFIAAAGLTLYIAIVTNLARIETQARPPKLPRALPILALLIAIIPLFFLALDRLHPFASSNVALYAVSAYTIYAGFKIHRKLNREPAPSIPPMIGQLIRLLLPLQAIWCLAARSLTGVLAAIVLLVLWPVSRAVSRRFYAS